MGLDISASTNLDEIFVGQDATANGSVNFEITGRTQEYPLHIAFCVDTSGSMSSEVDATGLTGIVKTALSDSDGPTKMDVAKGGLKKALGELSRDDSFGIVSFSSSASTAVSHTTGNRAGQVTSDIESMSASGGTSIDDGLLQSRKMLDRMPSEEAVEWIVLISDGKGSVPRDWELEQNYSDEGIVIQAAGVGDGYDRKQMLSLAQQTQGELEDIESPKNLGQFFKREVQNAKQVVALDAELELHPSDITNINEVYYSLAEQTSTVDPSWRGDTCVVDLGDVNHENPPEVVLEMDVNPESSSDVDLSATLVEAVLSTRRDSARDEMTTTVDLAPKVSGSDDDGEKAEAEVSGLAPDPEFILKKVSTLSQDGKLDEARRYLENNKQHLSQRKYQEAKDMIDEGDVAGLSTM
jgi:Mg-chelatase subunit ChlD